MSTNLTSIPISENQSNLNDSSQTRNMNAIETKPAKSEPASENDSTSCNKVEELTSSNQDSDPKSDGQVGDPIETNLDDQESSEQKNDSLTFSTAFTISFEDDNNKKLGIKDSIRKFAPPKPHTIEKQRPTKTDQSQENSLMSIESAPGGLSKHSTPRLHSASSRSSGRKSNSSSRHSNLSESAAFLIERMLNFNSAGGEPNSRGNNNLADKNLKSPSLKEKSRISQQNRNTTRSSDGVLDSEVDFCEEKSDNGTYIVGTDPESEAARKQIDELFGVVKAAEASVLADSASKTSESKVTGSNSRQSRVTDKKPFSRERQEHINRLACRNSSRSSSSSRQENPHVNSSSEQNRQQTRTSSHHSRNSSCDRTRRPNHKSKTRRATSQSSRHSSDRELSDCDTKSSRSLLHNEAMDAVNLEDNSPSNYPSMKFNRAFALRRARLGLGEPTRIPQNQVLANDSDQVNKINSSQRRHQINTMTYRANQNHVSGSASFCRDDGGRFSLRMKQNNPSVGRLGSNYGASNNRSTQQNTTLESYMSKVVENKVCNLTNMNSPSSESTQQRNLPQRHTLAYSAHGVTGLTCQSGDESEAISSTSRYKYLQKLACINKKAGLMDTDNESDSYSRCNHSSGQDHDIMNNYNLNDGRASTSAGRRDSTLQLGALDSLVISAISSLSLKIRQSVCDVLVEHAKKLPVENETRLIVEEILPQLSANPSNSKSPTSIEEIDQSLYFDLAKTLKNLKKVEQMVEVIALISSHLTSSYPGSSAQNSNPYESNVE